MQGKIKIDGLLDEPEWARVPPIGDFIQHDPHSGAPPTEPTEVRILYNDEALFIGVRCYDSRPKDIIAKEMARDAKLENDDRIEILVDTFHDRRNAYYFSTNPAGALVDGRITENNSPSLDWDGIWIVRSNTDDRGWTAEFEIPFKSLGFKPNNSTWGFNISRTLGRLREDSRWAAPSYDLYFNQVAMAGILAGIEGVSQGVGLDVKTYGLGGFNRDLRQARPTQGVGKAGVDFFYRLTSNLVSSTTLNTDFAETEVDTRQINLTRFPLFFPEKRAFFLEDAGIFDFAVSESYYGSTSQDFVPFFSRRIGLLEGSEVPILFGSKLTGKVGRFDVGLMDVQTRHSTVAPTRNFIIGRTKFNFWKQSYMGGLFTHGEPTGTSANTVGGIDLKLFTSNLWGTGKNLGITLFGSKTSTPEIRGRDNAYGYEISYPNDFLFLTLIQRTVEENYNPALGFVARKGVRYTDLRAEINPRPNFWHIRQMKHEFEYNEYYNLVHHAAESRRVFMAPLNWDFNSGAHVEFNWVPTYERLFVPFEIHPGVTIPVGGYWFHQFRGEFNTPTNKSLTWQETYWFGQFYNGTSHELVSTVKWRPNRHFTNSLELDQYFVRLQQGVFDAHLAMLKLDYAFTPFISLANFVQFDTNSRNLGLQTRFRWILKPGNDIIFVLNHSWQQNILDRFQNLETNFRAKLNYTFRF